MKKQKYDIKNKLIKKLKPIYSSFRRISNLIGGISLKHFRSPSFIFWTLVYPIILVLLFGAIFGLSTRVNYNLDILDLDQSQNSTDFITQIENQTSLSINLVNESIISPENWLKENNKIILLIIPENWGQNIQLKISSNITIFYDPSSSSAKAILEILEEAVAELNDVILSIKIIYGLIIENYILEDLSFINSLVPGIIMVSISTIALFTSLNYELEEKESGFLEKLSTTPTLKIELLISKYIWQILLILIASTLTVLFALIFDFTISSLHPLMLVFIIFGILTFSGIAMILIRFITNPDGVVFASVLISIPQILLSGALIPLDYFPTFLQYIARIFPLYYLSDGMRFLMLDLINQQYWIDFSISASFGIAFFIFGFLVTNWRRE